MAWGHIPTPRKDYHSAQRHAATQTYRHYSRGQIAAGALGPGTAAAQASAHRWFSHLTWQNHRDAVVAAHKAAREKAHARRLVEHQIRVNAQRQALDQSRARLNLMGITDVLSVLGHNSSISRGLVGPTVGRELSSALRFASANAKALWGTVSGNYGGKMPKTALGTRPGALGEVWAGSHNTARLSAHLARAAAHGDPRSRAILSKTLLHEWAHNRQRVQSNDRALIEGGAELYSRMLAHKIGLHDYNPTYQPFVRWLKSIDPDRRYTKRGQFHPSPRNAPRGFNQ